MARLAVILALAVLVASVALAAVASLSSVAPATAVLTVFVGGAEIQRAGSAARTAGRTGDRLVTGDTVVTGPASKAQLTFPDGSVSRLDSETQVTIATAGQQTALAQAGGLTWNRVRQLTGGAGFRIDGPNHTAAQVRGTEFGYYVEQDAAGAPVIWVDVWSGSVRVTGPTGSPVDGAGGQRVTVRQDAPAAAPVPIPDGDRRLDFTVFNTALNALRGPPLVMGGGSLRSGQTAGPYEVAVDSPTDLQLVLSWPGSSFELTVLDPAGGAVRQIQSSTPPLSVVIPRAQVTPGTWKARVRDLQSGVSEPYWLIVARAT